MNMEEEERQEGVEAVNLAIIVDLVVRVVAT
jgi:hypothetical protein